MAVVSMAVTFAHAMAPRLTLHLSQKCERTSIVSASRQHLHRTRAFVMSPPSAFGRRFATMVAAGRQSGMEHLPSPDPVAIAARGKEEPKPIVLIDQDSDAEATIVEISFGDRLGALLDTIKALKDLGLNVIRGVVSTEGPNLRRKKFLVTRLDNNKKVENPELLEAIRLTVINNLLQYHPESSEQLAMGGAFGGSSIKQAVVPLSIYCSSSVDSLTARSYNAFTRFLRNLALDVEKLDLDVATHISITRDGRRSLLSVETADRPGLLLEILKVICDISIYVESAEIDTEGLVAKDKFYVTYHGDHLSSSMEEVLTNALRYYLRRPDTEEDSY